MALERTWKWCSGVRREHARVRLETIHKRTRRCISRLNSVSLRDTLGDTLGDAFGEGRRGGAQEQAGGDSDGLVRSS